MNFKTKGVVLSQRKYNSEQKYLTLLSPERGLIDVRLRVFGQITNNTFQNIIVGGYYHFNIFEGKSGLVIDAAEPLELFFDLRYRPEQLALAQYFCELTKCLVPSQQRADRHLSLLLNSLWLLEKEKRSPDFIKSVFEFRMLAISGYMPNLVCCKKCCEYQKSKMYYLPYQSALICGDCLAKEPQPEVIELSVPVLHAMRFILYKPDKEIFQFRLNKQNETQLFYLCEKCVRMVLEHELVTLTIYHQFMKKRSNNS